MNAGDGGGMGGVFNAPILLVATTPLPAASQRTADGVPCIAGEVAIAIVGP